MVRELCVALVHSLKLIFLLDSYRIIVLIIHANQTQQQRIISNRNKCEFENRFFNSYYNYNINIYIRISSEVWVIIYFYEGF